MRKWPVYALLALLFIPKLSTAALPPAAGAIYHIPYRLTDTKHLMVRAKINGRGPFNFIIDTGAPDFFLSSDNAKKLGLAVGADKHANVTRLEIEGGAVLDKMRARVEDPSQLKGMNAMGLAGARIDGVFGYSVLARFKIEIDLTEPSMTWTRQNYTPPPPPSMEQLIGKSPPPSMKDVKQMEQVTKWASSMLAHKPDPPPVPRGFIGIELEDKEGPRILRVLPGSPAAKGGLLSGDKITKVAVGNADPEETPTVADLHRVMSSVLQLEAVRFTVTRAGAAKTIFVRAGKGGL
jgi:serine protease Do